VHVKHVILITSHGISAAVAAAVAHNALPRADIVVRGRDHTEWSLVGDSWTLFCDGLFCLLQVIGLWVLFALPVWSAAYKQAGCDTPSWFGISQVAEDAPGIGLVAKAAPDYDGPSFREVRYSLEKSVQQKQKTEDDRNAQHDTS
jgi:hypothetical protein